MNSFRSVSTKYQICSVPFRSVPFLLNSFRSVSTKYWLCSVSICSFPFLSVPFEFVPFRFYKISILLSFILFRFVSFLSVFAKNINHLSFPFHSNLFHSVPLNRNQFLSICCFLNIFNFPLRFVVLFVCNTNLTMFCLFPSPNRCA